MMYNQQFVLAILNEGSPVREIAGGVTLPFNSEYKIRLKNKNNVRTKARVWVDGRKVSGLGDFILHEGETLDLERFLDASMSQGRRFKFVPLSDGRFNDPTDPDNGIVKVEFYKELAIKIDFIDFKNPIKPLPTYPVDPYYPSNMHTSNHTVTDTNSGRGSSAGSLGVSSSRLIGASTSYYAFNSLPSKGQAGATVEGGNSNQTFTEGDDFETDAFPVTLTLRIQGPRTRTVSPKPQPQPSPQPRRFCNSCGARRKRSDNFCSGCGKKFHNKRRR